MGRFKVKEQGQTAVVVSLVEANERTGDIRTGESASFV